MRRELNSSALQIVIDNSTQHARDFRYADKCFTNEIVWIDRLAPSERMITRQKYDERLLCHQFVFEIRLLFPAKEGDIKLATLEVVGQRAPPP